jgi:Arc/MetJ-type ribon-helix-helix transcriptional regulator
MSIKVLVIPPPYSRPTISGLTEPNGMIGGMTHQKIAITLPEDQVASARKAVAEGRAPSVSAYVSQALARRDADDELADMLAEIYAEAGPPTDEDRAWARHALGLEA